MGYVYRYIDPDDSKVKYVGIVWSDKRELADRIYEHAYNDWWCIGRDWKIEYTETPINTRTDAEYMEAHFISLYHTGSDEGGYNIRKNGWGVSSFIHTEWNWKEYTDFKNIRQMIGLESLNYKRINVKFPYTALQKLLFDAIEGINCNMIKARHRSFTTYIYIPKQLRCVYFKDGSYYEVIHLRRSEANDDGYKKYNYICSEKEAHQMFDYLHRCYGYEKFKIYKPIQTFEECYGYA